MSLPSQSRRWALTRLSPPVLHQCHVTMCTVYRSSIACSPCTRLSKRCVWTDFCCNEAVASFAHATVPLACLCLALQVRCQVLHCLSTHFTATCTSKTGITHFIYSKHGNLYTYITYKTIVAKCELLTQALLITEFQSCYNNNNKKIVFTLQQHKKNIQHAPPELLHMHAHYHMSSKYPGQQIPQKFQRSHWQFSQKRLFTLKKSCISIAMWGLHLRPLNNCFTGRSRTTKSKLGSNVNCSEN